MNTDEEKNLNTFTLDLRNHSPEGVDILSSEPSHLISTTLYLLLTLLFTALLWSFIGKSDVIVTSKGSFIPDSKIQRAYAPLGGELIDIYITEGMPIKKGDILGRIHAVKAIQFSDAYINAKLALANKQKEFELFPIKKELMKKKAESLKQKYQTMRDILQKRSETTLARLAEEQKLALQKQRTELQKNSLELKQAKNEMEKYRRLYNSPGGGGISQSRLNEKNNAYKTAKVNYSLAQNKISELEMKFNKQYNKEKETQLQAEVQLVDSRLEYENQLQSIVQEEMKIKQGIRAAQIQVESTAMVSPENIDEDGFLKILSPYSGTITEIPFSQVGDKVQSKTPLATIAPENAKIMLEIEIPEFKRGLLREGLAVKIKVSAFAYQRYGFLSGTLDYISPTTRVSQQTKKPVYKGHVNLDKTIFVSNGIEYPLRFGMTATAEIIVRQRRVIDVVLDPLRGLAS